MIFIHGRTYPKFWIIDPSDIKEVIPRGDKDVGIHTIELKFRGAAVPYVIESADDQVSVKLLDHILQYWDCKEPTKLTLTSDLPNNICNNCVDFRNVALGKDVAYGTE